MCHLATERSSGTDVMLMHSVHQLAWLTGPCYHKESAQPLHYEMLKACHRISSMREDKANLIMKMNRIRSERKVNAEFSNFMRSLCFPWHFSWMYKPHFMIFIVEEKNRCLKICSHCFLLLTTNLDLAFYLLLYSSPSDKLGNLGGNGAGEKWLICYKIVTHFKTRFYTRILKHLTECTKWMQRGC